MSPEFIFKMLKIDEIGQELRRVQMLPADFELLNPNTRTCPIFRTRIDAELTKKLYQRAPVLINENSGENFWGVRFKVGGVALSYSMLNQLPVLPPSAFSEADIAFIVPRVLELVYTAWDMK